MERVYTTPRLDKLGIKPGMRVALVELEDKAFEAELRDRTHDVTHGEPLPDTDIVLYAADSIEALGRLPALRERIVPNGAIWVVSRKGKAATIRDVDVINAAKVGGARRQQGGELRRHADVAAPRDPAGAAAPTLIPAPDPLLPSAAWTSSSSSSSS